MNHTRVACTKPLDKLRTLSLWFDDGAGRAASKLFHLMLNDSQQLTETTIYGLQLFYLMLWPLGSSFLPQKLLLRMCPDIWKQATLPKHATIYDCLYKIVQSSGTLHPLPQLIKTNPGGELTALDL